MRHIILLALSSVLLTGCYVKTNETEIAVRVQKIGLIGEAGVVKDTYAPGQIHFFIPFINEMYKFDTKLQTMTMVYSRSKGERFRDDLLFKTIDGNDISLDVEVQYRIDPKKAHHLLQFAAQSNFEIKHKLIRPVTRSIPRDIFGELKTEEFYISENREKKREKTLNKLNEILNPLGIIVETLLLSDYRFNDDYQKAIEDKKVADQQAEKNKSATAAAVEEYLRKEEEARGEVNKMIANIDGEFRKSKIEADAYYEKQKSIAQAIKAEGIAEAKGIRQLNRALAGAGGRTMVKLEIAKAMKNKKIMLLPLSGGGGINLKKTDVNQLLEVYGVDALSKDK